MQIRYLRCIFILGGRKACLCRLWKRFHRPTLKLIELGQWKSAHVPRETQHRHLFELNGNATGCECNVSRIAITGNEVSPLKKNTRTKPIRQRGIMKRQVRWYCITMREAEFVVIHRRSEGLSFHGVSMICAKCAHLLAICVKTIAWRDCFGVSRFRWPGRTGSLAM